MALRTLANGTRSALRCIIIAQKRTIHLVYFRLFPGA